MSILLTIVGFALGETDAEAPKKKEEGKDVKDVKEAVKEGVDEVSVLLRFSINRGKK